LLPFSLMKPTNIIQFLKKFEIKKLIRWLYKRLPNLNFLHRNLSTQGLVYRKKVRLRSENNNLNKIWIDVQKIYYGVYELGKGQSSLASFQYRATVSLKGYYCYYYFLDGFGSTDDDINIFGA
jgi:hypothetical protein